MSGVIAELFVLLGVKGADDTNKKLKSTDSGLKEIKSSALATKAAIVGVIYGLEQLMSKSIQTGTGLNEFSNYTMESARTLQQWQYAGQQFGVGADEVTGSIKNVQSAMAKMLMGEGAPAGMGMLGRFVGLKGTIEEYKDTFGMMQKLQEFAKKVPSAAGNEVLKSFGMSEKMISAFRQNAFRQDLFNRAPVISEGQANTLMKVGAMWENVFQKIQIKVANFTAKNGGDIIKDIDIIVDSLIRLAQALATLGKNMKAMETLEMIITLLSAFLTASSKFIDTMGDVLYGDLEQKKKAVMDLISPSSQYSADAKNKLNKDAADQSKFINEHPNWLMKLLGPDRTQPKPEQPQNGASIQFEQNLIFKHDGKDAAQVGRDARSGTDQAFRQLTAQGLVT